MMEALVDAGVVRKEKCGRVSVSAEWSRGRGRDEWGDGEPSTTRRASSRRRVSSPCARAGTRERYKTRCYTRRCTVCGTRGTILRDGVTIFISATRSTTPSAAWVEFLRELRYDVSVEEIVVNEFQAYMATERVLFGPDASAGKSSSSKKSSGGRRRAVARSPRRNVNFAPPRATSSSIPLDAATSPSSGSPRDRSSVENSER